MERWIWEDRGEEVVGPVDFWIGMDPEEDGGWSGKDPEGVGGGARRGMDGTSP